MKKYILPILFVSTLSLPVMADGHYPLFEEIYPRLILPLVISYIVGFLITIGAWNLSTNKRVDKEEVSLSKATILFTDYWFDYSITRRVTTLIYFLVSSFSWGNVTFGLILCLTGGILLGSVVIILSILLFFILRVILELFISVIKINENTTSLVKLRYKELEDNNK